MSINLTSKISKYSVKEIAEFKKMGYNINEFGELATEVKLQKIIRTNTDTQTMKTIELKSFAIKSRVNSEQRESVLRQTANKATRVQEWWMDEERLAKGLSTMKKPGVDYSLLPDGTKVCRCCQNRYDKDLFSVTNANKDGKSPSCKQCDSKRTKSYLADIKLRNK